MVKILQIIETSDLAYGGPIEAARQIAGVWAKQGHSHDLLTLDPPSEVHLNDYDGDIYAVGEPRTRSIPSRYRYAPKMVPWLKENAGNYDAIIVSGLWRYFALGAKRALAGGDVPYFVFTHGMLDPWFRETYPVKHLGKQVSWWLAEGPLLANARNVLFTCEEEKVVAENAFWPYRVNGQSVGYGTKDVEGDPATQIAAFRKVMPQLDGRRFLLFLSRIHEKKGCDLLISAFAKIADLDPLQDLVIAGPDQMGLMAKLKAQAQELGIADRVHFPGMLKGDEKFGAFRASEAFVLTSHQENFGIVVAEALACAKPVLISNKVNIWREIETDHAGLVEPDTDEGSERLLRRFMAMDEGQRAAMSEQARRTFLDRFHIEKTATDLIEFIRSRIGK